MPKTKKKSKPEPELSMSDFGVKQEFYRNSGTHYVCKCGYCISIYGNGPEMWEHIKECAVAQEYYDFKVWKASKEYQAFSEWKNSRMPSGEKK